jgi:hypothetical protein
MDRPASRLVPHAGRPAFGSRMKTNHRGMVQTLANLKRAAEVATRR